MKKSILSVFSLLALAFSVGAFNVVQVNSRCVKSPADVLVATPQGYNNDSMAYPVVYLLNGFGGDHLTWSKVCNLDSIATEYRCIIVCPAGLNSWYWNVPTDSSLRVEDYITTELIPWVDSTYRTRPDRLYRAVSGLSMGGHGALWLAFRHPHLFANVGSTSGGVDLRPFPDNWNLRAMLGPRDSFPERWNSYTVANAVDSIKPHTYNIIFDCGTGDFFYPVNCDFHRALLQRGIDHTFLTGPGIHNGDYWHRSIIPHFSFFHSAFYCR